MTTRPFVLCALSLTLACAWMAYPAAHHSFAMYDAAKPVTLRGRVATFRWINPHSVFTITADDDGAVWAIELSSPSNMTRIGWSRTTLAVGDHVEVSVSPMRDGSKGAACRQLKFLDKNVMLECGSATAIHVGEKEN